MKKLIFTLIVTMCLFIPMNISALSFDDVVYIGAKTPKITSTSEISDWSSETEEQDCDSILGNPEDESSVAWLLDQILTYATLIGMMLVIVLSSIDFLTVVVKSDDKSMAAAGRKLALRLMMALLMFFIPTLTKAMLDIFGFTSDATCGLQS